MSARAVLPIALGLLGLLVAWVAGLDGVIYAPFWLLAALPGVPLGRALTGRHFFGWVAGLAAGYATTCLVVWALIASGLIGTGTLAAAWAIEAAALWLAARRIKSPWVTLPVWTLPQPPFIAAALLAIYTGALAISLLRGMDDIDCGCGDAAQAVSWALVVRNGFLMVLAAVAMLPSASRGVSLLELGTVVPACIAVILVYCSIELAIANEQRQRRYFARRRESRP